MLGEIIGKVLVIDPVQQVILIQEMVIKASSRHAGAGAYDLYGDLLKLLLTYQ